jgi:uncharacterized protein YggU (UPF0235/DUF167 family)
VAAPLPFAPARDGVRLAVRLVPGASAERVLGIAAEADGGVALKLSVTAPPEGGKANAALLRVLARLLRVPKGHLALVLGHADRRKVVHVRGDPAILSRTVEEGLRPWLEPVS